MTILYNGRNYYVELLRRARNGDPFDLTWAGVAVRVAVASRTRHARLSNGMVASVDLV